MKLFSKIAAAAVVSMGLAAGFASTAHAIECDGPYQIINGYDRIVAPYCQDNYLAAVAREYGYQVSNYTIRQNPNKKKDVCYLVGNDNRVSDICASVRDGGRDKAY